MPPEDSRYPIDWLRIAEKDLRRLEQFRSACQKITGFYFLERYPFIKESGLTEEDVQSSLEQTRELVEKLRNSFKRE
jgi:HEPN domain-containing protein